VTKKRRATLAALLSLFVMGLGQLYCGQTRRAAILLTIELAGYLASVALLAHLLSFSGLIVLYVWIALAIGLKIFAVLDAFVGARRTGDLELRRYNRWYVYLSVIGAMAVVQSAFEIPIAPYSIPAASMMPTLHVGDYLYVDRTAYRDRPPGRGDTVVFKLPTDNRTDFIKRIVGLPGEAVQVSAGILHIDGIAVPRHRQGAVETVLGGRPVRMTTYRETLPGDRTHDIWEIDDRQAFDNTPVYSVPAGHYFMMGDNRDNSLDSRALSQVGFVPAANIVGPARIVFFSHNGAAAWWQVWRWPGAIRLDRIGREIR